MPGRILLCRFHDRLHSEVPPRTAAGILVLWVLSLLDYYLTLFQTARGILELNPVLAPFFNNNQYIMALVAKMLLTFPGICILSIYYKRPSAKAALPLVIVVYAVLLVYHLLNLNL